MPTLVPSSEETKIYELCVMTQPDLMEKAEAQLTKDIDALLLEVGAKVVFKDSWGKRGLAYKIGGHMEGKFTVYYIDADPSKIRALDTALRLEKGVLRHLIVIPPKGYEAVSYAAKYEEWLKNRETVTEMRAREKAEKVEERVKAKAKVEAKRMEAKKKEKKAPAPKMSAGSIDTELDKLLSDSDLSI